MSQNRIEHRKLDKSPDLRNKGFKMNLHRKYGVNVGAKFHLFSETLWWVLIDGIIWFFIFCWASHVTYFKIKRGIPMLCRFGFASDLRSRDSKPLYSVNMFHCQLSVNSRIFIILSKSGLASTLRSKKRFDRWFWRNYKCDKMIHRSWTISSINQPSSIFVSFSFWY